MKVFVTGATGFVGSAVVKELLQAGHQVLGLVRSENGAKVLRSVGAEVHFGDLNNIESICNGAALADAVIHTAFNHDDFTVFKESCENDRRIIEALGEVFMGSDNPIVITSALGLLPRGRVVYESDSPAPGPNPRIASEQAADTVAASGVKIAVVRLSPTVHGEGDHGFITRLISIAKETGISVYQDEPLNYWPAVHRLDAAKLYRLALEKAAPGGTRYHASAEQGVPLKDVAVAIGQALNIPVVVKNKEEATAHFGSFAHFAAMDVQASSDETQRVLGWQPVGTELIQDIKDVYLKS
ncbi:SDR family oxidoreductase [Pedobacter metabolipauper]|uniref:Nucleoside-diphosphate-sugar epimerase n=1 Tax=Pedobacter metabolipauper TaxID=425513 RepID=A0A4R6STM9_9SPHI|nr:SDR family oxidoreductase [Pedobacter metabolipauper]TDQ08316.1 nucleoside-diphosphate-sugar epimerase [Pedobacter metabolipauper]